MIRRTRLALRLLPALPLIAACGGAIRGAGPAPATLTRAELRRAIDSLVTAPEFRNANFGILIVDPERGDTLYARNAAKLFMPASNMKIVTGATALAQLGPDYRFRTAFVARGVRRDSVLAGDLVVVGRGDPTLSDHMRRDAMLPMREIADSLWTRGIRRITGRLTSGGDAFPDAIYGYGWGWDDFDYPYSSGVDELFFNEGFTRVIVRGGAAPGVPPTATTLPIPGYPALRVTAATVAPPAPLADGAADTVRARRPRIRLARDSATGGVIVGGTIVTADSVDDEITYVTPAAGYFAALRVALAERGITVGGAASDTLAPVETLFATLSPPLREIMPALEKPSQNQIAEILLKTLALEKTGVGTADSGRRVVERQLIAWGADSSGFAVRDGSGLSRHDYLSPATIVRVLSAIRADTAFQVFYDALPIAGVDGTISGRMKGTPAEGNVHAKTGTVDKARSLSGYVTSADGRLLVFSVLSNNFTTPVSAVTRVQDEIGARLASLRLAR